MTNNVPARPRFQRSSQFAQYLMQRLRIHTYPINLKYVCSHVIATIQPYSYYAKCLGCTVPDYIDIVTAQDGFTLYDGKRQRYVIAYNDTVPNYPHPLDVGARIRPHPLRPLQRVRRNPV